MRRAVMVAVLFIVGFGLSMLRTVIREGSLPHETD